MEHNCGLTSIGSLKPGSHAQVWSPTQSSLVDFTQSRIGVKNVFSTKAQSRFMAAVFDGVLRLPLSCRAHITMRLFHFSSVSKARGEARALEGCRVS